MKLLEKSPVVPFTGATEAVMSTMLGLKIRSITDEFGPGAGETWPVIEILELPA